MPFQHNTTWRETNSSWFVDNDGEVLDEHLSEVSLRYQLTKELQDKEQINVLGSHSLF